MDVVDVVERFSEISVAGWSGLFGTEHEGLRSDVVGRRLSMCGFLL